MPPPTNPPPPLFDILPPLHTLLTRLLLPDALTPSPPTPLSPKDLATAASSITAKIQKARTAARELPGMEMGIKEQEEVIRELEGESRRLRGVEEEIALAARRRLEGDEGGEAMES
ncbi:RNA polymerase II transcription mediator complex subunit 9-domain-containing protein [Usnea florida]